MENRENRDKKMKKMSEKREWTNGTGRTNRKSGEMMNTRARGDQNNGKSGKNGGKPWTSTEKTLKSMDKKSAVQVTEHHGHAAKKNSLCPHFKSCGGCQYLDMPYEKQLEHKKKEVADLLRPFCKVETIIGMDDPFHYRNKVHAVMARDRKGRIISGVYKEGTHTVLPVETCLIENKKADEIIGTIRELLPSFKMKVFDEDTGYGFLRHVLVRTAHATGEIMVVLITASPVFPSKNNFVKALRKVHPEITTVVQNVNDRNTSMVLGEKEHVLYGPGFIVDVLCGKKFRISSKSFYQINPVQTEKLYNLAIEAAGLTGKEMVVDAYCGIGTIGIVAASAAKEVIGVELNKDAVRDAVTNAKVNGEKNIRFYNNDAGKFMVQMASQNAHADVVFMDPPRSGSTEEFMDAVAILNPDRVVYVSCNPETLARDLAYFKKKGYRAEKAWAVDQFPMTGHVETVVLLSKLNTKQHIEVELNLDELDLTSAESKATYDEIKAYVLEKHGLKVSSLYISQVKRKCGLDVGQNYNLSKKEDAKVPQCPPEKEAAIMDALKHFQMI
nr:23S rRNA (uracil(1939)-C(5))-methyltransferase RlmD [Clostridium sp. AM45-5]